jgi:hypothetical protein
MQELNRELLYTACRITENGISEYQAFKNRSSKKCPQVLYYDISAATDKQTHKQLTSCPIFISGRLTNTGFTSSFASRSWLLLQDAGYSSAPGSGSVFTNSMLCCQNKAVVQ